MPGPFVHVSPEASPWKGRPRIPVLDRIHRSGFPDGADDGIRTRGLLLGKQACCRCTTSAWPGFPNGFGPYPLRSAIGVLSCTREPRPRCEGWDSNPRPPGYEPGGLPNCPTPHGRAFPGTPHGRGVFRTARKGPFPGGGEKGPAYAGRPSPPSTPWRNRTSVDGFGDRRTATVLMAYCVFRSSIVKRPRRLPGFVPVRRHATVCVPVAGAIPYGVSHLMGEPDAGRRDDQEHAYRQACPERPCDPQYPQYGLHAEPQPPVDGGRAQKREHPEQRHLQGRLCLFNRKWAV